MALSHIPTTPPSWISPVILIYRNLHIHTHIHTHTHRHIRYINAISMTQLYTISIITIILTDATNIYHAHNPSAMPASPHTPSYLHHLHYLHHLVNVLYHIKLPLVDHHSNPHYHSSTTPTKLTCPINSKAHSMVSTPSCWQPKPHSSMSKIYYNSLYFHLLSIISSAFGS